MNRKTFGGILILLGVSMWEVGPRINLPFDINLLIHISLVLPGVYFYLRG